MKNQRFKPILFSTDMVQAILNGTKTQTRRIIKGVNQVGEQLLSLDGKKEIYYQTDKGIIKQKYNVGNVLWVRETFRLSDYPSSEGIFEYRASCENPFAIWNKGIWKPSIHMPKKACRLFLEITNVRVERLLDITEQDAKAEGVKLDNDFGYNCYFCNGIGHKGNISPCEDGFFKSATPSFESLWCKINGEESLLKNPYVWVVEFKRVDKPEHFIL